MSFDNTQDEYKAIFDSLIETPPRTTCRLRVLCTPCEKVIANSHTAADIVKSIIQQVKKDSIDYIVVLTCDQQYFFFYHTITGTHAPTELQKQYEFVNYRTQWSCKDFKLLVDQLNPDDILYQAQLQLSQIQKPQPTTVSSIQTDAVQQQCTYAPPMFQQLSPEQQNTMQNAEQQNTKMRLRDSDSGFTIEQQYFTGSQTRKNEQRVAMVNDEVQALNTQTNLRFEDFLIAERDKNFAFYHGIKPVGKPYTDIYAVSNAYYAVCA